MRKGLVDIVSDGDRTFLVTTAGGLKRCGGQGDVLAGTVGNFINYNYPLTNFKPVEKDFDT